MEPRSEQPLRDKRDVALVTGAGKRIGGAIARDLGRAGYAVGVHYNGSRAEADGVRDAIVEGGGEAVSLPCDLLDPQAVRRLVGQCHDALGPVGVLVNNASIFQADGIGAFDDALWDANMNIHVRAPVYLADMLARQLPADANGVVINMIDQRVWRLTPRFMSYTLSKSALWTATRTLAQALAPRVRVCGIGPGPTLANDRQAPGDFANQRRLVPLERGPDLDEICRTVRFIIETPSLTGQMIAVDGGQHLAWETPDVLGADE